MAAQPEHAEQASAQDVLRATLGNGLRVEIVRNSLAPVVATSLNYLVGADETPPGFPGTAHAQEHMMFRGRPGLSADQLANIGSILGGRFNADTRQSVTQYFYTVPADDLGIALHIEALRMHPAFPQRAFDVVRQQIKDQVSGRLQSSGYLAHRAAQHALVPAGDPTLREALPRRIDALKLDDLRKYYQEAFRPDLTAIVVIGDVTPERARAVIERGFGNWHATGDPPPTMLPRVPPSHASMSAVPDTSRAQDDVTLV